MQIAGIVAEYNPFHLGHVHQLAETRTRFGATHLVCVMSGSFVQRGEAALLSKRARAEAALCGGADLVLELPVPWATARAEQFAFGAVAMLHALGCVDLLSFGSESGDIGLLWQIAELLEDPGFVPALQAALPQASSFAAARQQAVSDRLGAAAAETLRRPNDTLGIEYCRALIRLGSAIRPVCVVRVGAGHGEQIPADGYASASQLRGLFRAQKNTEAMPFMPSASYDLCVDAQQHGRITDPALLERAVLARLRSLSPEEFERLPDQSEGLHNRLYRAAGEARSLVEFLSLATAKRYPTARIRRAAVHALLGITAEDGAGAPPYLRVLGMNEHGKEILSAAKGGCTLPIATSLAKLRALDEQAARIAGLEARATDLAALAMADIPPCGEDFTLPPVLFPPEAPPSPQSGI